MKTAIQKILMVTILLVLANNAVADTYVCQLLLKDNNGLYNIKMDEGVLDTNQLRFKDRLDLTGNRDSVYRVSINDNQMEIIAYDITAGTRDAYKKISLPFDQVEVPVTFWSYNIHCFKK